MDLLTAALHFTHPMREDVNKRHISTPLCETSIGTCIQGPFFFVERILVLTPGAPQSTEIRIAFAGLPGVVSCRDPDTIRCEAAQANRWLKCQPSSYVRLEAYGFFGLSEGA